jgi:hypothetical protein
MDSTPLTAALQAEYLHLQKTIEDFDGKALTIKAWSITFSLGVFVGAFASGKAAVLLVAAGASALFWLLETMWKAFQLGYAARVDEIEAHFRGAAATPTPPHQISAAWRRRWKATPASEFWRMACWPHVALPHAAVSAAGLLLFGLQHAGLFAL